MNAILRTETRDCEGQLLPEHCYEVGTFHPSTDYARLALHNLKILSENGSLAYSRRFLLNGLDCGGASLASQDCQS